MTRPVQGFLTNDGKYFDSETDANAYEAITDLNASLDTVLTKHGFSGGFHSFLMEILRHYLLDKRAIIMRYCELVQEVPEEPGENDIRRPFSQPYTVDNKDETTTGPVETLDFDLVDVPDDYIVLDIPDAEIHTDFVSAFSDPVGEDDPYPEVEGVDEEVRLDGVRTEDVHQ